MAESITIKALQDASLDAKSLEDVVNGDEAKQVTTRLGETYPSVKKAIKTMFENGGLPATPFATKALMNASALADGSYAQVTDDGGNDGLYVRVSGLWEKSSYDPVSSSVTQAISVLDNRLGNIGYRDKAFAVRSYDDKDLFSVASDGSVSVVGYDESLQDILVGVPQNQEASNVIYSFLDSVGQQLLTISNDGGLYLAGDRESLQYRLYKLNNFQKLPLIMSALHQDDKSVLYNVVKNNDNSDPLKQQVRVSSSTDTSPAGSNRIAAGIKTPEGLLVVYGERIYPYNGDGQGVRMMQKVVSITNNRVTAVSEKVQIETPEQDAGIVKHPMLGRADNGDIVMVYDYRGGAEGNYQQYVRTSSDNGASWSMKREIAQNPAVNDQITATGSTGTMLTLASGRLVVPLYSKNVIWCVYSDDNGINWTHGALASGNIEGVSRNIAEPSATVLSNGDILITARASTESYKVLFVSKDNGETVELVRLAEDLVSTPCASSIYFDKDTGVLLHGTPTSIEGWQRKDFQISISFNEGQTFDAAFKPFNPEWYVGYSQIIKYADDTYILLYEGDQVFSAINSSEHIALLIFNNKELLDNVDYI